MTETPQNPPPGFYPDQNGLQRYWDGTAWTDQTQQAAAATTVTPQRGERPWFKKKRFIIPTAVVALFLIGGIAGGSEGGSDGDKETTSSSSTDDEATDVATEKPTATKTPTAAPEPEPEPEEPSLTPAQENAVRAAENYIDYAPFSKSGLIKQLEFEDYASKDATFAVNYLKPDYKKQAARAAKAYLDYSSFSRDGLIQQLKFEGYTQDQAEYGVGKTGL